MIGPYRTKKNTASQSQSAFGRRLTQLCGWILWIFALFLALALISYNPSDPSFNTSAQQEPTNLLGHTGACISDLLIQWVGIASLYFVAVFLAWGWSLVRRQHLSWFLFRILALFCATPVIASVITAIPLAVTNRSIIQWPSQAGLGGSMGLVTAQTAFEAAYATFGPAGKILIWFLGLIFAIILVPLSMGLTRYEWHRLIRFFNKIISGSFYILFRKKRKKPDSEIYQNYKSFLPENNYDRSSFQPSHSMQIDQDYTPPSYHESVRETTLTTYPSAKKQEASFLAPDNTPVFDPVPTNNEVVKERSINTIAVLKTMNTEHDAPPEEPIPYTNNAIPTPLSKPKGIFSFLSKTDTNSSAEVNHLTKNSTYEGASGSTWSLPPSSLLNQNLNNISNQPTPEMLHANARMLETILDDYGVKGCIKNILCGPVVTLYELEPAPGIRSARVVGLSDDIARSLAVISVRIATVPGRNVIGIEVPNNTREVIYFSEMINTDAWNKYNAKLCLALGKNIFGEPIYTNLAKMPHLLIAGTTGSGKSVGVNSMILSLLYRLSPDECRLILIDPKMLELSVYEGIPHLLTPVVTDPHKAISALKWAVREMERRYRLMSQLGVRNIDGYNLRINSASHQNKMMTKRIQTGFDPETGKPTFEEQQIPLEHFSYIVVIIDEMADLMMVAGKEIETTVQRLAQMARAAGIHVIMATQRPSVDVITGTIKANFPTRISFQVISKFDSRTILGEQGAEQLLGQGDMLFMQAGGRIARIHGPFVSDDEVEQVVQYLRKQGEPSYVEDVTAEPEEDSNSNDRSGNNASDELYNQAVALVLKEGKASTSFIQRHLSIGYNRAAKIIEQMEKERIVSAANHVGKREILINKALE
ncbi:hypothetical protein COMNV_00812 [Commensalibacter sp. Nvir]|uniref:DNA translocase FtsK n=1 Tax=Commensalibacter sp. Nvir TaxID=3069817 RepID=UPI002D4919D3|nr:hypothetical protein COMNV_00812 [Commensalibacter sp. Nvir]